MATSPTPSIDSIRGTNSIGSYGEHNDYLSDSPLTLSGSSPPASDSAISDDFSSTGGTNSINSQHKTSSTSSSSSSSGLSSSSESGIVPCNSSVVKTNLCNGTISGNVCNTSLSNGSTVPQCTACKSKESDAVAKCFECVNFLCANCAAAHKYMHCFSGHNVSMISNLEETSLSVLNTDGSQSLSELSFSSSLSMVLNSQQLQSSTESPQISNGQFSKMSLVGNIFQSTLKQNNVAANRREEIYSKLTVKSSMTNDTNDVMQSSLMQVTSENKTDTSSQYFCNKHKTELLKYYCRTCCVSVCNECVASDHQNGIHDIEHSQNVLQKSSENIISNIATEIRGKLGDIVSAVNNAEANISKIKIQYQKAYNEINETYQFFCSMLEERKQEVFKELEVFYNAKISSNNAWTSKSKDLIEKAFHCCDNLDRSSKVQNISEVLLLKKSIETQHEIFTRDLQSPFELEFVSNYQSIQVGVRNTFGYVRATIEESPSAQRQPPIARPNSQSSLSPGLLSNNIPPLCLPSNILERSFSSHSNDILVQNCSTPSIGFDSNEVSKRLTASNFTAFVNDVGSSINPYEKWSNGGSESLFNGISEQYGIRLNSTNPNSGNNCVLTNTVANNVNVQVGTDSIMSLSSKMLSIYPPKSQIKRQKMIYHCKFGEFGVMEGQFTEPSGVAVNAQNDIIVADTNNHRIQIFDKEGRFKFQFGECGKRDSQLLYPNRVAVVKTSGDIIVTERSPTHQIQIYNQYGQFVRKFGANILQHPRGVTVDNVGRIIVVECKVMRVIIFDQNGNVIQKFGCSKHLEFPNGVVVNDKQEIFISDNRAHCVKVFNYEGQYLRQIGGEGITNYPIGVGINSNGEILIADNHNNFNLTIFTQDGHLLSALESKVKHAQCFDVALMDDGSVVLASKDYRLYIYRYVQVQPVGL